MNAMLQTRLNHLYHGRRNKSLPKDIYSTSIIAEKRKTPQQIFLPQVLWPRNPALHEEMYNEEIRYTVAHPQPEAAMTGNLAQPFELLTYSLQVPYALKMTSTGLLPPHDMLWYMESFFGNPMIDRTDTLKRCIKTKILDPIPPIDRTFSKNFPDICYDRAHQIIQRAVREHRRILIMWSGGIDSTAALCALLRVATPEQKELLIVALTSLSIQEYPAFYEQHIQHKCRTIEILSTQEMNGMGTLYESDGLPSSSMPHLVVTGECGDQIFGSMYMQYAFEPPVLPSGKKNEFSGCLLKPWREFLPPVLIALKAIPLNAANDWLQWIEPQIQRAPIPIITMYDFLWWVNYSMKWQHVTLRILASQRHLTEDMYHRTEHFFRFREFEQWSFHNHPHKLPDLNNWLSYKIVLKYFIYEFTGDAHYRDWKGKERSLRLIPRDNTLNENSHVVVAIDSNFRPVWWGRYSISLSRLQQKYGVVARSMLLPESELIPQVANPVSWNAHDPSKASGRRGRPRLPGLGYAAAALAGAAGVAAIWAFTHRRSKRGMRRHHGRLSSHMNESEFDSDNHDSGE